MVGLGAANLAAGLFQGFPISSSSSRTPVAEASGRRPSSPGWWERRRWPALVVFAPALLQHLPTAALAAVVISSAIGLFELSDLARIYRIQRWEFWLSLGCYGGGGRPRCHPWHRHRHRHRGDRVPLGWLAPHFAVMGRVEGSAVTTT
jgi:hypothetical protein